jgi:hypothetical protein
MKIEVSNAPETDVIMRNTEMQRHADTSEFRQVTN